MLNTDPTTLYPNDPEEQEAHPGTPFILTGSFTDPGLGSTHTASINWGDGTTSTIDDSSEYVNGAGQTVPELVEPTATSPGTYTIAHFYYSDATNAAPKTITVTVTNNGSLSDTVSETIDPQPTVTTETSGNVTLGALPPPVLTATAVLTGGYEETGTLTFTLIAPNGATVDTESVTTVDGDGTYSTPTGYTLPTTGTVTGSYQWNVSYSGDPNNAHTSDIDDPTGQVEVNPANPTLSGTPSASSVTLGTTAPTLNDTVTLSNGYYETGSLTVTLVYNNQTVYTDVIGLGGASDAGALSFNTATSGSTAGGYMLPTTGTVTGTYQWNVSYAGDTNNNPASDNNAVDQQVTVSSAPLAVQNFEIEDGIAERSFIQYLDVNFNQGVSSYASVLQDLAAGLAGSDPNAFVELMWYGGNLTASSTPAGTVNLFNTGTTAAVNLIGNDLNINFGPKGITSLLTETSVQGTGSPTTSFGDGWYALGIDPTGNPSNGQAIWLPFFRLLGSATGDETVSGPYTTPGTDAYNVYHAEGQLGSLLNADVNGDGTVNSKDLLEAITAKGHTVGSTEPVNFPEFQLFAGAAAMSPGSVATITQAQVQTLLPQAIDAWKAAGLGAAGVQQLEDVQVQVGNLARASWAWKRPARSQSIRPPRATTGTWAQSAARVRHSARPVRTARRWPCPGARPSLTSIS